MFFFYRFCNVRKEDMIKLLREVHNSYVRLDIINYSQIVLIPKSEAPFVVGDYKLIVLLNSSFKIVPKILAERLSSIIGQLMRGHQSGFIIGRHILKGVAIA